MQPQTAHKYFKYVTPHVGTVLGLLYETLDIVTALEKFRDKLKDYTVRKFDNVKYVIYVVTEMEDTMKCFE